MPSELRTQRDGRLRKRWCGRYKRNGRRHYINLGVRILGTPPASRSLNSLFDDWAERADFTGRFDFWRLQRLSTLVES